MSSLRRSLTEYLAVRRALGYKLHKQETLLGQFLDYLEAHGQERITTAEALAWAALPAGGESWHSYRLQAVRGFARYLHAIDPDVQVPAVGLLPDRPHRAMPFLYTDEQIAALILAAGQLRSTRKLGSSHRIATHQTLIGLLSVTGMRIGEATALDRSDFDSREGVLLVRGAKFGKSRELPLHRSTVLALRRYLRRSGRPPSPPESPRCSSRRRAPVCVSARSMMSSGDWCAALRLSLAGRQAPHDCTICATRSRCALCSTPTARARTSRPVWRC